MFVSEYELGWAAGFYEGEGTIGAVNRHGTHPRYLHLSVQQNDRAPLDRFQIAVGGCGHIYRRERKARARYGDRLYFEFALTRATDVVAVLRLLWPGLSERRRAQARRALEAYTSHKMLRVRIDTKLVVMPEEFSA